jgi:hypothetical protein
MRRFDYGMLLLLLLALLLLLPQLLLLPPLLLWQLCIVIYQGDAV